MADSGACSKVRVVQSGGIAGEVTLADVDRSALDSSQASAFDDACRDLSGLAGASSGQDDPIGADIPRYEVELVSAGGQKRSFMLPGDPGGRAAGPNVAEIASRLASLKR